MGLGNEYVKVLDDFFADCPKTVFAAIAVSYIARDPTIFNDEGEMNPFIVRQELIDEWWILYHNKMVPQKPPFPERKPVNPPPAGDDEANRVRELLMKATTPGPGRDG